jgi:hypothetical protein
MAIQAIAGEYLASLHHTPERGASTMSASKKTEKLGVWVTPELRDRIEQVVKKQPRDTTVADFIREALRAHLDGQADLIGSRAHFYRAFQQRIDALEVRLNQLEAAQTFYLNVILSLLSISASITVSQLSGKQVSAEKLIEHALQIAQRDGAALSVRLVQTGRQLGLPPEEDDR